MDVAPWVPDDFWREWRSAIKTHKPDALTVAETWFDASKYFVGDMFDSTMNYIFRTAVLEYAAGGNARTLYAHLEHLREAYPPQALFALMNLLSSHDQRRALHALGWRGDANDTTDTTNPAGPATMQLAKQRLKLALALYFQMTYPGAPAVYYGDEVGVTGGDNPFNRATYPWADLGGKPDAALLAEFKELIKLRSDHPVLRRGSLDAPLYTDEHVIVWLRRHPGQLALVAVNNALNPRNVKLQLPANARAAQLRATDGGADLAVRQGSVVAEIPALGGRVWITP